MEMMVVAGEAGGVQLQTRTQGCYRRGDVAAVSGVHAEEVGDGGRFAR